MLFVYNITTNASVAATNKKLTILKLTHGIITQLDVQFPPGPNGYLHLQITDGLHQVFPLNPEGDFASSFVNISFREYLPLLSVPYELQAYTWNLDDTYAHLVIVRIGILPVSVAAPWLMSFADKIKNALGVG